MLAEWESRDLHAEAFDATYAWSWHEALVEIAQGRKQDLSGLFIYYSWNESALPPDTLRMTCVTNHDQNAWESTEFEAFGPALDAAIALSVVGDGIPLVYNGQEAGNPRRLQFFEKDPVVWREHPEGALYKKLFALKHRNTALWNAHWGATMIAVPNSVPERVLSFVRRNAANAVFAVFNFSGAPQSVTFHDSLYHGRYEDFASGATIELDAATRLELPPWGYRVFAR
jgi:glycosidase